MMARTEQAGSGFPAQSVRSPACECHGTFAGRLVFVVQARNQRLGTRQVGDAADTLASGPHGLPGLGFVVDRLQLLAIVHFALARQAGFVEAGFLQTLAQEARRYT